MFKKTSIRSGQQQKYYADRKVNRAAHLSDTL